LTATYNPGTASVVSTDFVIQSGGANITIDADGWVTGVAAGSATVIARTTDVNSVTFDSSPITITVADITAGTKIHWNFQQNPGGWAFGDGADSGNNANLPFVKYGNNMTIGGTNVRFNTGQAPGAHMVGASTGYHSGAANNIEIARISKIPGTNYRVYVYATTAANAGDGARKVEVNLGGTAYTNPNGLHGTADPFTTTTAEFGPDFIYNGAADAAAIIYTRGGGARIFDFYIEYQ